VVAWRQLTETSLAPVQTSASEGHSWRPAVALDGAGDPWVVADAWQDGSYDIVAIHPRHGRLTVAGGGQLQARVSVAGDGRDGVWVAWEEGRKQWGGPFRSINLMWNNVTDLKGPLHTFRRIRVAHIDAMGRVRVPADAFPMPMLVKARRRPRRSPGVRDVGVFYERPELAVDGRGRPWVAYRHFANLQAGTRAKLRQYVEEGWRVYARVLTDEGWSGPFAFAEHQRDGMQRLSVSPTGNGIALAWTVGRTDRREQAASGGGVVHGRASLDGGGPPTQLAVAGRDTAAAAPSPQRTWPPVRVGERDYQAYFGDLHRHTDLSYCFPFYDGSVEDAYRYALDAARLDFLGITDHTLDIARGDVRSRIWWRSVKEADRHRIAGEFATYYAYERSHVDTDHNVISLSPEWLRPPEPPIADLWSEIEDNDTFTIPHTPLTQPLWEHHDDGKRPLVEVYQGFRQLTSFSRVHDGLRKGFHLGFIASSDHLSTNGSFVGVWSEEPGREPIFRSMQARRTFGATARIRILLRAGSRFMGERIRANGPVQLTLELDGTAPFERIEVWLDGALERVLPAGNAKIRHEWTQEEFPPGKEHWIYVRAVQEDRNRVWSSPLWIATSNGAPG
jgi:hypothetical protein